MSVTLEETTHGIERILEQETHADPAEISALLNNQRYVLYLKVPVYASKYFDHFGITYNSLEFGGALGLFSVWLKTADDDMDVRGGSGVDVLQRLEQLSNGTSSNKEELTLMSLTDVLYGLISTNYQAFFNELSLLRKKVMSEKDSQSMGELIERRKKTGRHTALTTLEFSKPYVSHISDEFAQFMVHLLEANMLMDSFFDLKSDYSNGELRFHPGFIDKILLQSEAAKENLGLLVKYPFLVNDYKRAVKKLPGYLRKESSSHPNVHT